LGLTRRFQAHIVNFADDFVICCRYKAVEALEWTRQIMSKLRLQINESKTHIHRVPEENVEFLGYTFGRCYSTQTGTSYIGTRPSKKRISRICGEISDATSQRRLLLDVGEMVRILNRKLIGWSNYFSLGPVSPAYRAVDAHTRYRLRQWLRRKHQGQSRPGVMSYPDEYLYDSLGLVRLERRTRSFPWAQA
jgi:RNA-directed DNA polymerase